jgi:leader peptidase (prepilin peptidase) / N-methyltransferase
MQHQFNVGARAQVCNARETRHMLRPFFGRYTHTGMLLLYAIAIAGLAGLAFGSFLNVCISRWPKEESVIVPRSHCPHCERLLAWWENIPLISFLALRGRCRTCKSSIGLRYPLVELAVGGLWALAVWKTLALTPDHDFVSLSYIDFLNGFALLVFVWLLVGLAALDAENLWLPDRLIWPGLILGFVLCIVRPSLETYNINGSAAEWQHRTGVSGSYWFLGVVVGAGALLSVRFLYRLYRGREGMGFGDVKLMAMLGGWLGAKISLVAMAFGIVVTALYAISLLTIPAVRASRDDWREKALPFGSFLAVGGIVAGFWGQPIVNTYLHWSGF